MTREECKIILMKKRHLGEKQAEEKLLETEREFENQSEERKKQWPLSHEYWALSNMEFPR